MEKNNFLDEFQKSLFVVARFPKIKEFYNELEISLREYDIKDYYFPVTELNEPECMFFDDKLIHWLKVKSTSIENNIYPIKNISSIHFSIIYDQQTLGFLKEPEKDELKLIITFSGQEQNRIIIKSEANDITTLNRIKNNLLKQL